jgi:hypothetical protein
MYQTIGGLQADSAAVAVVRATSAKRVEIVAGIPFTVTTVSVLQSLAGPQLGSTLSLRQLGSATIRPEAGGGPVQSNMDYVVFLQHFTFGAGHDTDQFIVTGEPAGLFGFRAGRLSRLDPESIDLPASLSLPELVAQLRK